MIEIFNRSHYENVLATKVNPAWILNERIPGYDSVEKMDAIVLGRTLREHQRHRKAPLSERHAHLEVFLERVEGGAKRTVSLAD
jgi:hypothetical protein